MPKKAFGVIYNLACLSKGQKNLSITFSKYAQLLKQHKYVQSVILCINPAILIPFF